MAPDQQTERDSLYNRRAALYDRIYHWKDYGTESARVRELLLAEGVVDGCRSFH